MPEDKQASLHDDQGTFGFIGDGRMYTLDLLQPAGRAKTEGGSEGQLHIQFWRSTDEEIVYQRDWKFTVEAINGGLIETDDLYMTRAPESGYQKQWTISKKGLPERLREKNVYVRHFYLHIYNGLYARLSIEFRPYLTRGKYQATAMINYSINTRGEPYLNAFKEFEWGR